MTEAQQETIINAINTHFNHAVIKHEVLYDMFTVTLRKDAVIPAIQWLYDNEEMKFRFLTTMCALHYPDQKDELGMMYQLMWKHQRQHSTNHQRLKYLTGLQ